MEGSGNEEENAVAQALAKLSKLETAEDVVAELGHLTKEQLVRRGKKKGEKTQNPENSCGARMRCTAARRCSR